MITLREFMELAIDNFYKINIWYNEEQRELLNQVELGEIEEELEKIGKKELLYHNIGSWDIQEYVNGKLANEFTLNID